MRLLRLLCVLVAFATLASACGDDGVDAGSTSTTTEAPPDDPEPTTPDDTEPGDESTTTTTLPELFASAPGVTAESIKLGVVYIDFEAVSAFVDLDHGSYEAAYRAVIENVNDNGGVLGRQIEPVFAPINLLDPASGQRYCVGRWRGGSLGVTPGQSDRQC